MGFGRYVFSNLDGKVTTTFVEGPRGHQVRCQSPELPCSYLDLKELHESGAPIPSELSMSREDLAELVAELDTVANHLAGYENLDQVCADGYGVVSTQSANMGVHLVNGPYHHDGIFDLKKPEVLLLAMDGGERLNYRELGDCVDGKWTGDPRMQIVGASYMLDTEQFGGNHPDGFAGPIDNWHMHYHSCTGEFGAGFTTKEKCDAAGGRYTPKIGWMIHAYVVPDFDNQMGVFANWNPMIWPRTEDPEWASSAAAVVSDPTNKVTTIFDFAFENAIEIEAGEKLTFHNADTFVHTVTSGTPGAPSLEFDSEDLWMDKGFSLTLDRPGTYPFYCRYHPGMTGSLVVTPASR